MQWTSEYKIKNIGNKNTGNSENTTNYSKTSMARTSLGPWKFIRDMGSSSHWGLIMA